MWLQPIFLLDRQKKRSFRQGYGSLSTVSVEQGSLTLFPLAPQFLWLQIWMNVSLTMLPRTMKDLSASTSVTTMWVATSVLAGLATSYRVTTTRAKVKRNFKRSEGSRKGALHAGRMGEIT